MSMPLPDEPDLDYADQAPDPNADTALLEAPRYVRTEVAPYASPPEQMAAMWATARELRAAKSAKVDVGGRSRVTARSSDDVGEVPRNAGSLGTRLEKAGWQLRMQQSRVRVEDLRYAGSTDEHDAGDVRTPGHERQYVGMQAVLERDGVRIAHFWATWERRQVGAKPGWKFLDAHTWDVALGSVFEPSATAFDEWVSVFAPKPESKRKPKAEPEQGVWIG